MAEQLSKSITYVFSLNLSSSDGGFLVQELVHEGNITEKTLKVSVILKLF